MLWGGGRNNDQVQLVWGNLSNLQGVQSCLSRQRSGGIFRAGNMALANAGVRLDPFVGGIDDLAQLDVGQDALGNSHPPTSNVGIRAHRGLLPDHPTKRLRMMVALWPPKPKEFDMMFLACTGREALGT